MIEKLFIKNYLIIKEATIEFTKGLNILTGETGAGKSIIIDALSLILGERADYSIIKNETEKLIIEGLFNFSQKDSNKKNDIYKDIKNFLIDRKIPLFGENLDDIIIIRRELYKKGISRNFINDYPVSISDLKDFGRLIIDIHSQNEHQLLLDKSTHILQLDDYIIQEDKEFSLMLSKYKTLYEVYSEKIYELKNLLNKRNEYFEKKEFLEFQLKEINSVNPQENEDEVLEKELSKLENVELINITINNCLNLLKGEEINITDSIHNIIKELRKIINFDKEIEEVVKDFETVYTYIKELNNTLSSYVSNIQFDDRKIEEIRERLGQLSFLKKKYRMTLNEIINKSEQLKEELNFTENFDFEIEKREKEIIKIKDNLSQLALDISEKRKAYAEKMASSVMNYFKEVGLETAKFIVNFSYNKESTDEYFNINIENKNKNCIKTQLSNIGIDDIEYFINTNIIKEDANKLNNNNNLELDNYLPLKKVVSGGEISRIMLSIKAALANKDKVPILVFDEIDAGVSGRIAEKVGNLLKELSKSHQIISITHLPQIAVFGENNLNVSKQILKTEKGKETITFIKKLTRDEKVQEIAKLLSGEKITPASLKAAEEMLKLAEKRNN